MASSVAQYLGLARRQAAQAGQYISKEAPVYYKQVMEQNKKYVVGDASDETISTLGKQLVFTTLASIPRRYAHAAEELAAVQKKWASRNDLTLQEVAISALFVGEVYAWFCVGEIVGRGFTLTGYKV